MVIVTYEKKVNKSKNILPDKKYVYFSSLPEAKEWIKAIRKVDYTTDYSNFKIKIT